MASKTHNEYALREARNLRRIRLEISEYKATGKMLLPNVIKALIIVTSLFLIFKIFTEPGHKDGAEAEAFCQSLIPQLEAYKPLMGSSRIRSTWCFRPVLNFLRSYSR